MGLLRKIIPWVFKTTPGESAPAASGGGGVEPTDLMSGGRTEFGADGRGDRGYASAARASAETTDFGADGKGAVASKGYPDEESREILEPLQRKARKFLRQREVWEQRWLRNLLTYAGNPHYDTERFARVDLLDAADDDQNPIYMRSNHTGRIVRGISSRMMSRKTLVRAVPSSGDQEDIQAAEAATNSLRFAQRETRSKMKNRTLAKRILVMGNGFKVARWDESAAAQEIVDEQETPMRPAAMRNASRWGQIGQVSAEVLSNFEVVADIEIPQLEDQPLFFLMQRVDKEWVREKYPEVDSTSREYYNTDWQEGIEEKYREVLGIMQGEDDAAEGDCLLFTAMKHVDGSGRGLSARYEVTQFIGNVILGRGEIDHLNVTKYDCFELEGCFYSQSLVDMLFTLQVEYNRTLSDEQLHARLHAHPPILLPRGCGIKEDQFVNSPGAVYEYVPADKGGGEPKPLMPPPFNRDVRELRVSIRDEMESLSSFKEIWQGGVPAGVRSGKAISELNQMVYANWQETFEAYDEAEAVHWAVILLLMRNNYRERRLIEVTGRNKAAEVYALTGADLRNTQDVIVEMAPGAETQEDKEEFALKLFEAGAFQPGREKELASLFEFMGRTPMDDTMDKFAIGRKLGQDFIRRVEQGEQVTIEPFYPHEILAEVLVEHMSKPSFALKTLDERERFAVLLMQVKSYMAHKAMMQEQLMTGGPEMVQRSGVGAGVA